MKNVVSAINEDDLGNLSLEILDYADRITEIFDKIDLCMERLPNYYQGPPSKELIEFYNRLTPNYKIIKDNIVSYSDDFIALIQKMQENDQYITKLFQNYTDETMNRIKSINEKGE